MIKSLHRLLPGLVSVSLVLGASHLKAQSQARSKVSEALPSYQAQVAVKGSIELPGTDSLSDVGDEWTRGFAGFHPEAKLVYQPKLTKEAITGLLSGQAPLVLLARELTAEETASFQAKFGYIPMRIPVSIDANVILVNKSNPIKTISMQQLDAIYGRDRLGGAKAPIQVWGDLGLKGEWAKRPINAYARKEGTAIRASFGNTVLMKGDFRPGILDKEDNASLAESVLTDPNGIAFGPLAAWYASVKVVPVIPYGGSDARMPTQELVTSSLYPMPRLYYAYLNRAPGKPVPPATLELLRYILSKEGQNAVADVGLMPGPVEFITIALRRLSR